MAWPSALFHGDCIVPHRLMKRLFVLLLAGLLLGAGAVDAKRKDSAEDLDRLGLAALMIRDGHYGRAEAVLAEVDESNEDLDKARFYTLRGLVGLNQGRLDAAKQDFRAAVQAGQEDRILFVYLAQAHFRLQEYREALAAIAEAGAAAERIPAIYSMRAQAHWNLGEKIQAWRVLDAATTQFPDQHEFLRRKVFLLIELGLYQAAADLGRRYLEVAEPDAQDYLAIGSALRRGKQLDAALRFLESAHLRFPEDRKVLVELAHAYLDRGDRTAAADLMEQAAIMDPDLLVEAAELHRKSGGLYRALYLNAQVPEPAEKLRQRLAILLQLERFEMVAGMEDSLMRAGLLGDQNIRYALAYAFFKSGEFDLAEKHLAPLTDGDLFRKAVQLRQVMGECRSEPWKCY